MYERILGLLLIGAVIKLMDDFLDKEIDRILEKNNYAILIGNSILPYCLLLMTIALYLNFEENTTFFIASYATGMAQDYDKKLPTNIFAWQESVFILFFSILYISFYDTVYALILILCLQLIDDLMDFKQDKYVNDFNYIKIVGIIPGVILILLLILISYKYFPLKLVYFSIAVIILYVIDYLFQNYGFRFLN